MITIYRKHQLNCLHFSSVANIDLQVLLFNINIWVNFQLFIILWQWSNFIDSSRWSRGYIMYLYRFFASGLLFTEITKRFELNWSNVAITTTARLGLRWLPTVSWKVVKMQIFAFSKSFPWARGVDAYTYF